MRKGICLICKKKGLVFIQVRTLKRVSYTFRVCINCHHEIGVQDIERKLQSSMLEELAEKNRRIRNYMNKIKLTMWD